MGKSQDLYIEAKKIIPGGTQLLSKRPEMSLPDMWPAYYEKARGCEVWDLDGNKYIDASYMGIGSCILGYADETVDSAATNAIKKGSMSTLNCPEEVELANLLCQIHPWAQMVRYARTGGEAMTIAIRIARARTGKDLVLFCGYHGWHDWYLSSNIANDRSLDGHLLPGLNPSGVPRGLKGSSIPFNYNDTDGFLKLIKEHKDNIAAVVMEPLRHNYPQKGFLETIRKVTSDSNIVMIFDEITVGWRLNLGGAHLNFGIYPDIAVFAKAISNGYPMATIIGRRDTMNAAQNTFISSTYWTERIGPTAALATIKKLRKENVSEFLIRTGERIKKGWMEAADKNGLKIHVFHIAPLAHFAFEYEKPLVLKTLFTQLMFEKGFLATTAFYVAYAHKDKYANSYLKATDESFNFISKAVKEGNPQKYLKKTVCHSDFKRLT